MTEFSKIKIPFALALLAAMLTLTPLIQTYGTTSYLLFGYPITVNFVYALFGGLLGLSVYLYAVGLIGDKPAYEFINKIGHATYAIALLVPPLFVVLYPVSLIAIVIQSIWNNPAFTKIVELASSAIVGVIASILSNWIYAAFSARDKRDRIEKLRTEENKLLARAKQLFNDGYYDLAVAGSWRAFEVALVKAFEATGERIRPRSFKALFDSARKKELLNEQQIRSMNAIREIRNDAVHTDRQVTAQEAQEALCLAEKIIASLNQIEDRCYFCGQRFPVTALEADDVTGAKVCTSCGKKNPGWRDTLMSMGMDP